MTAMLQVDGISKNFGGLKALDDCSLSLEQGSITGLIGPNGSGKTTLFNVITGFLRPNAGKVIFEGKQLTGQPVYRIANLGIGRTFQVSCLFPKLTVWENLLVAYPHQVGESLFSVFTASNRLKQQEEEQMVRAKNILKRIGLSQKVEEPAANLGAPEARMLEIGRQLMFGPRLLLLDEPSSGVNPAMLDRLAEIILDLNHEGLTFLIIGHNLSFIMKICQHLHVLKYGKLIASGSPQVVAHDENVIEAYLGVRA